RLDVVLSRTLERRLPLYSDGVDAAGPFEIPECARDEREQQRPDFPHGEPTAWAFLSTRRQLRVLREIVAYLEPVGLRVRVDVPERSVLQRTVERTQAYAHGLRHCIASADDRRPAVRAEDTVHALDAQALERLVPFDDDEVLRRNERARREGRSCRFPAAGTMTEVARTELAAHLVLHGTAQTTTTIHR